MSPRRGARLPICSVGSQRPSGARTICVTSPRRSKRHGSSKARIHASDEARRLENAEELRALASGIASAIDGEDEAVLTILGGVERHLSAIQRIDPTLARLQELYDSAYYNLEALARELEEYEASIDLDPARLDEVRSHAC